MGRSLWIFCVIQISNFASFSVFRSITMITSLKLSIQYYTNTNLCVFSHLTVVRQLVLGQNSFVAWSTWLTRSVSFLKPALLLFKPLCAPSIRSHTAFSARSSFSFHTLYVFFGMYGFMCFKFHNFQSAPKKSVKNSLMSEKTIDFSFSVYRQKNCLKKLKGFTLTLALKSPSCFTYKSTKNDNYHVCLCYFANRWRTNPCNSNFL